MSTGKTVRYQPIFPSRPRRPSPTPSRDHPRALLVQLRSEVRLANAALQRIKDGTYGTCAGCGNPINEARLDSIPTASHCINCA